MKTKETKTVRVRIQYTERIRYNQIVEIPEEDFREILSTNRRCMEDSQISPIIKHINPRDISDTEGISEVQIYEVDDDDSTKEDGKEWEPK